MTHKNITFFTSREELRILLIKLIRSYNYRYHSSIKMRPVDVTENTEHILQTRQQEEEDSKSGRAAAALPLKSWVRIHKLKNIFSKGYSKTFTSEIFQIIRISREKPHLYTLRDSFGETIEGRFYKYELLPAQL